MGGGRTHGTPGPPPAYYNVPWRLPHPPTPTKHILREMPPESANFQADFGAFGCPRVGGSLAFSIFVALVSGKSSGISPILLGMIGNTKLSQFEIPGSEFQATKFRVPLGAGTPLVNQCVGQFPRWGQATLTEGAPPPKEEFCCDRGRCRKNSVVTEGTNRIGGWDSKRNTSHLVSLENPVFDLFGDLRL